MRVTLGKHRNLVRDGVPQLAGVLALVTGDQDRRWGHSPAEASGEGEFGLDQDGEVEDAGQGSVLGKEVGRLMRGWENGEAGGEDPGEEVAGEGALLFLGGEGGELNRGTAVKGEGWGSATTQRVELESAGCSDSRSLPAQSNSRQM